MYGDKSRRPTHGIVVALQLVWGTLFLNMKCNKKLFIFEESTLEKGGNKFSFIDRYFKIAYCCTNSQNLSLRTNE